MRGKKQCSDSNRILSISPPTTLEDDNDIQSSLAPYIQTYLSHSTTNDTCGCLPVPFERAAALSWLRPSFDSDILEGQFKTSSNEHFTHRFRYALAYVIGVSAVWLGYSTYRYPFNLYTPLLFCVLAIIMAITFYITFQDLYQQHSQTLAVITAVALVITTILFCLICPLTISHFTMVNFSIVVIYTIFPLPPYVSLILCVGLTATFQIVQYMMTDPSSTPYGFIIRSLCLFCVNIIGFHIDVMVNVRMRGTFMKVGQRLLVRRQLEAEKQLKEKMIHSVMPPKVAGWLLNPNPSLADSDGPSKSSSSSGDIRSLFRPFNMVRMDNVSILFADIVGFTRMSSNKTAEEIVDILNDLFERFDELCLLNGCEKISTLGDCYYCVSGCPEPREDHAKCCVEMGLGMIDAIHEFDVERSEDVNMRVGVHTGTVLCGVVGTRRFKFDVWSNDVSFANKLESTGLAGRVHVSQQTVNFLNKAYRLEEFKSSLDVPTYLIEARVAPPMSQVRMALPSPPNTPMSISPPSTPQRTRLNSLNAGHKRPHYLSLITDVRSKFASLPNVLDSTSVRRHTPNKSSSIKWQFPFPKPWRDTSPETINLESVERSDSVQRLDLSAQEGNLQEEEEISLCPSGNSRKDSGIKSASRRSSIQQQIYLMNNLGQHRVSGYFTSSRSSIPHSESECDISEACRSPIGDNLGNCFYSLRKQSDLQLIRCVRDITEKNYFVKVPLRTFSLRFRSAKLESGYRQQAYRLYDNACDSPVTLSTARYNTFLDIMISSIVLACIITGLLIISIPSPQLIVVMVISLILQLTAFTLCCLCLKPAFAPTVGWRAKVITLFSDYCPWHIVGGILISLPLALTLTGFSKLIYHQPFSNLTNTQNAFNFLEGNQIELPGMEFTTFYYTFLVIASLAHFCNFTQLNFLVKSFIAIFSILLYLGLMFIEQCQFNNRDFVSTVFISKFIEENIFISYMALHTREITICCEPLIDIVSELNLNAFHAQRYFNLGNKFLDIFYNRNEGSDSVLYVTDDGFKFIEALNQLMADENSWKSLLLTSIAEYINYDRYELFLNILLIVSLIVLLNREFEISYRASYFFNVESNKDKIHVQHLKNQADMLLENIIPKHVSIELKNRAKYCENHTDVAIIFASIVNFSKLYDETFSGGKEYLRYLNELISDFDELLGLSCFRNVEKIKTIGSTFMAASGLNPQLRKQNQHEYDHIFELIEFAKQMYQVVEQFNCDLLGFNLVLRVGFNIGEVTSGVIGSSKLLYDIWGDTVNVASRMDSTGVDGRLQLPYSCLKYLSERYQFEPRGSVYVKGKGDIMVFLLKS